MKNVLTSSLTARGLMNCLILAFGILQVSAPVVAQTITTVAGPGDGGPASPALVNPGGVLVDSQYNLFFTDNLYIWKVSPDGVMTTVAGNGEAGFSGDGGPATSARLNYPNGIAIDARGNLFISDRFNNRIRRVSPDGTISTVAGNGEWEFSGDGGPATQAGITDPSGIAVDISGNLFIVDGNLRIRKVVPNGTISTIAGSNEAGFSGDGGPATNAHMRDIRGITVDASGSLFFADRENDRIRKVSPDGIISTVAGNGNTYSFSGDGGGAVQASLSQPLAVAVDRQGNLLIVDTGNNRIRKVTPNGIITTVAGNGEEGGFSGDGGPATNARLSHPQGIAVDARGDFFIADTGNRRVRKVTMPVPPLSVVSFSLMNALTGQEIKPLTAGDVLNLSTLPTRNLTIRANTSPATVGSVVLVLSGQQNSSRTETEAPFAVFGDSKGKYHSWTPAVGSYSLTALPYTGPNGTGMPGTPLVVDFRVVEGLTVVSFSLIDADTELELKPLEYGILNLSTVPTRNLNIRVNTSPATVGSVVMVLSGKQNRTRTETEAPYAVFGDTNGHYHPWMPAYGEYNLTATPYPEPNGRGRAGAPLSIRFWVGSAAPGGRLGVESSAETEDLQVLSYPNPFTEFFQVQVSGQRPAKLPLVIYDMTGRIVLHVEDAMTDQPFRLGPANGPGRYVLQVGEGKMTRRHKLLKAP